MSKRITVTLTERQWDDVLYAIGDGLEHLDMTVNLGGEDAPTIRQWESRIKRVERLDSMIRSQLKEGGSA